MSFPPCFFVVLYIFVIMKKLPSLSAEKTEILFQAEQFYRHEDNSNKIMRERSELKDSVLPSDPEPNAVCTDTTSHSRILVHVIMSIIFSFGLKT